MNDIALQNAGEGAESAFTFSEGFFNWLSEEHFSLLASTYQASQILTIGSFHGTPWIKHFPFLNCMGFCHNNGLLVASTANRVVLMNHLDGDISAAHFEKETDRVFYPRVSWITGDLKIHDVAFTDQDEIVFVNTAFDCLATVDLNHSFQPLWQPPYLRKQKKWAARDCSHLNGLCLENGMPAYVTALGKSNVAKGWRDHKAAGGLLFDVRSGEILCDTLSMPHSPRLYKGKLWLLNSGTGEFGWFDHTRSQFEPLAFCPGFARGLSFYKNYAIITLSNMRRYKSFQGLALETNLADRNMDPMCGVLAVNLETGAIEHWLSVQGHIREFYDISVLEGICRPSIINMEQSITKNICLPPTAETFDQLPAQLSNQKQSHH